MVFVMGTGPTRKNPWVPGRSHAAAVAACQSALACARKARRVRREIRWRWRLAGSQTAACTETKRWADPGDLKRCILTGNALSGVKEPEEPQVMRRHSS